MNKQNIASALLTIENSISSVKTVSLLPDHTGIMQPLNTYVFIILTAMIIILLSVNIIWLRAVMHF